MSTSHQAQKILYRCPHCSQLARISETLVGRTVDCPQCGRPFRAEAPSAMPIDESTLAAEDALAVPEIAAGSSDDEEVLLVRHPAMLRPHPFRFLLLLLLLGLGTAALASSLFWEQGLVFNGRQWLMPTVLQWAGLVLMLVGALWLFGWWLQTRTDELKVTSKRTIQRSGLVSRFTTEVQHDDVRNIQVDQGFYQRLVGVGNLAVSSAGQSNLEIRILGISRPDQVAKVIRDMQ